MTSLSFATSNPLLKVLKVLGVIAKNIISGPTSLGDLGHFLEFCLNFEFDENVCHPLENR